MLTNRLSERNSDVFRNYKSGLTFYIFVNWKESTCLNVYLSLMVIIYCIDVMTEITL
jgi:hypothetical protein